MAHRIREGALSEPVSEKERSVTAPWFLDLNGQPLELSIRPGEVGVYLEDTKILHIRDERTGISRTLTPTVDVTIDHSACFFELQFRDPADRLRFMPSMIIDKDGLAFLANDELDGWTFSNRAMFETFCVFVASPIYNPFETPIPTGTSGLCGDAQKRTLFYRALEADDDDDEDEDDADPYLGREHEYPIDEKYCFFVSCRVETDRPIAAWDRIERRDTQLPPGKYTCLVKRWDRTTGEPERIKLEGKSKAGAWVDESHLDWAVLAREVDLAHAHVDAVRERLPFDPAPYRPISPDWLAAAKAAPPALQLPRTPLPKPMPAATTQPKGGLFGLARKLLKR